MSSGATFGCCVLLTVLLVAVSALADQSSGGGPSTNVTFVSVWNDSTATEYPGDTLALGQLYNPTGTAANGGVFVLGSVNLSTIQPLTGDTTWTLSASPYNFVVTSEVPSICTAESNSIVIYNLMTGATLATYPQSSNFGASPTLIATKDTFYVLGITNSTPFTAFDARTGAVKWSSPNDVHASQFAVGAASNRVFFYNDNTFTLRAYHAATGGLLWSEALQIVPEENIPFVMMDGSLGLPTSTFGYNLTVTAYGELTGKILWNVTAPIINQGATLVAESFIAISDNSASVIAALSPTDGSLLWVANTVGPITDMCHVGGVIYGVVYDVNVGVVIVAIDATTGGALGTYLPAFDPSTVSCARIGSEDYLFVTGGVGGGTLQEPTTAPWTAAFTVSR